MLSLKKNIFAEKFSGKNWRFDSKQSNSKFKIDLRTHQVGNLPSIKFAFLDVASLSTYLHRVKNPPSLKVSHLPPLKLTFRLYHTTTDFDFEGIFLMKA
jgi:hypothetical protein